MQCEICEYDFNDSDRKPRALHCQHSFCTICMEKLIETMEQGRLKCPLCRNVHTPTPATLDDIKVNYLAVRFLQQLGCSSEILVQSATASIVDHEPPQHAGLCSTHNAYKVLFCSTCQVFICVACGMVNHGEKRECQVQNVADYSIEAKQVVEQQVKHKLLLYTFTKAKVSAAIRSVALEKQVAENKITQLDDKRKKAEEEISELSREDDRLTKLFSEGRQKMQVLVTMLTSLAAVSNLLELTDVEIQVQQLCCVLQQWEDSTLATLPRRPELAVQRLMLSSKINYANLKQVLMEVESTGRELWAVLHENGPRYAKLSINSNRVLLHELQNIPLPKDTLTVPYGRVLALESKSMPTTFLALSWPGFLGGIVTIRVEDNLRGRQFVLLCSGRKGPSYVGSCLIKVNNLGQPGEHIWGGDLDSLNLGEIVPGAVNEGSYDEQPLVAGLVCATYAGNVAKAARFSICTRDRPSVTGNKIIGNVMAGIVTLREASYLPDITTVTVCACGLVLPE